MKWRLIDRIDDFAAWDAIRGRKTVSLEEYNLLEPLGEKGSLPGSLILESSVQAAQWLVMASSGFSQTCILQGVETFTFSRPSMPGEVLDIRARIIHKEMAVLKMTCQSLVNGQPFGVGELAVALFPLEELAVADECRILWQELYAKA